MDVMVERIEKLERSNRRIRWAGGVVACLGVIGLVMGQKATPSAIPKVLEVDKIVAKEIVSELYTLQKGDDFRGEWGAHDSSTSFSLHSPGLSSGSKYFTGLGTSIHMAANFMSKEERNMWREKSKNALNEPYAETASSQSSILMRSTTPEKPGYKTSWGINNEGEAAISILRGTLLFDVTGKSRPRGSWTASPTEGTRFTIKDKKGRLRAALGRSETVTTETGVTHSRPESSLVLFDEKGTVLHEAP